MSWQGNDVLMAPVCNCLCLAGVRSQPFKTFSQWELTKIILLKVFNNLLALMV